MTINIITNDFQREKIAEAVLDNIAAKAELTDLVRPNLVTRLTDTLPLFRTAWRDCTAAEGRREGQIVARDELVGSLDQVIRHFWSSLDQRSRRMKHSSQVMRFYRPSGPKRPDLTVNRDVVKLGEFLIEGDALAVAAGYPAMTNPDIAEVQQYLADAKAATLAVEQADLEHAQCQDVLRGYREVMDAALRKVAQQVQLEMQDKPASYVRRLLRRFGYRFTINGEDNVVDTAVPDGDGSPDGEVDPGSGDPGDGGVDPGVDPGAAGDPAGSGDPADPAQGTGDPVTTGDPVQALETVN